MYYICVCIKYTLIISYKIEILLEFYFIFFQNMSLKTWKYVALATYTFRDIDTNIRSSVSLSHNKVKT
jgi:hypothetical protein